MKGPITISHRPRAPRGAHRRRARRGWLAGLAAAACLGAAPPALALPLISEL